MRRVGALSDSDIGPCVYARLIGLNFDDYMHLLEMREARRFWTMLEHPECFNAVFGDDGEDGGTHEQDAPDDMTPVQFMELLGMNVEESGEGYAVGR